MIDQARLNRIRWRARRGLLENDIVLEKFFERHADTMSEEDVVGLDALLELSDNDLLDLIMARKELTDLEIAPNQPTAQILNILRSIH
jgi:antitoxin CptB